MGCRCPGSGVALQALTQRKVDLAFRVYQALLGGAAGGQEAQAMDTDTQVSRGVGAGVRGRGLAMLIKTHLLHLTM